MPFGNATGSNAQPIDHVKHIVVLMLENRSFDHMLGFLSLPVALGGQGRTDVNGLTGVEFNDDGFTLVPRAAPRVGALPTGELLPERPGVGTPPAVAPRRYPVHRLDQTIQPVNPAHSAGASRQQASTAAHPMSGFVASYRTVLDAAGRADISPGTVMGYHTGEQLPTYQFLAEHFLVCDAWHASVLGPTWPNRMFFYAGRANNLTGNGNARKALLGARQDEEYPMPERITLDVLRDHGVDYAVYSDDVAWVRLFPGRRREEQRRFQSFDADCRNGKLPAFAYIDPNFSDLGNIDHANDDQAPADPIRAQLLVAQIYESLRLSGRLDDTLFVVCYDEHGGFYDHVPPPPVLAGQNDPSDTDFTFDTYGVRVPAFLVTPYVPVGGVSHVQFDHTSVVRLVLDKFCAGASLGTRPQTATSLAVALTDRPAGRIAHPSAAEIVSKLEALLESRRRSEQRPGVQALHE